MSDDIRELSDSFRHPQEEPSDHCYTILQDHGPNNGGWGPATIHMPGLPQPTPVVYTGTQSEALTLFFIAARQLAQATGKPTRVCRYSQREDLRVFGGSN